MVKNILKLWARLNEKFKRFIKFGVVGGTGSAISLLILYVLVEDGNWNKYLAWLVGMVIGILCNFILNTMFTWADRKAASRPDALKRLIKYYTTSAFTIALNYLLFFVFNTFGFYYIVSAALAVIICAVANFFIADRLIWKRVG